MNKIEYINHVYFNREKEFCARNFLLDDMQTAVKALIYRDALTAAIVARNKTFSNKKEFSGPGGTQILFGNFDPDFMLPIEGIRKIFDCGLVVTMRKLIKKEFNEKRADKISPYDMPGRKTGGDFINDLAGIVRADFDLFARTPQYKTMVEFTGSDIGTLWEELETAISSAQKLRDSNRYNSILKHDEAVCLHKDNEPQKRVFGAPREREMTPGIVLTERPYHDNANILICEYTVFMEDLSKIIEKYFSSIYGMIGHRPLPRQLEGNLYDSTQKAFRALGIDDNQYLETANSLKERMPTCLNLLHWNVAPAT